VPKEVIINMKGPQMVWVPKVTWRTWVRGLGRLAQRSCEDSSLEAKLASWTYVAQVPRLR
jgi:hypothetical protein